MEDNTAPTASQNELGVEMSDAELEAFVDQSLGIKPQKKDDTEEDKHDESEKKDDKDESDEDVEEVEAPTPTKEQEKEDEEDQEAAEIADVDTSDLWIEIEGLEVDDQGNTKPKKVKIGLEDGIPDDIKFKSDKQLYEVLDAMNEMRQIRSDRIAEHDKAIEESEKSSQAESDRAAILARWDNETNDLIEAGLIEKPKAKAADPEKGFTEKEIESDPGLKRIDEVFKFMAKENAERSKSGKTRIASFAAAFNLLVKQENAAEEKEKEKQESELAKKRGALVGGGSSTGGGKKDDFVYKSGSAKSIWAVKTDDL